MSCKESLLETMPNMGTALAAVRPRMKIQCRFMS